MLEMQMDMIPLRADAAPVADLHRHSAADHIAGGQVLGRGRVTLHEALAVGVRQIAAFAARAFGDQAARAVDAGGVELRELHVLQGQAGAQRHRVAVAGAGVRRGAGEIRAPVTAGGQRHDVAVEGVQSAVVQVPCKDAAADALVHDQVQGEVFNEELGVVFQRLLIQGVQDRVPGAVGGGAGALGGAGAVVRGHAAEGALVDLALRGARERHAVMLQFDHGRGGLAAHVFNRVLVAQPVRALDRVIHVPSPVVLPHVAQCRAHAALRGHGVAAGGEDLGHACGAEALGGHAERGAQARAARADDDDVVAMVNDVVGGGHGVVSPHAAEAETHAEHGEHRAAADHDGEQDDHRRGENLLPLRMQVILQDYLQPGLRVIEQAREEDEQQGRGRRRGDPLAHDRVFPRRQGGQREDEPQRERRQQHGAEPLPPPFADSPLPRARQADLPQQRAEIHADPLLTPAGPTPWRRSTGWNRARQRNRSGNSSPNPTPCPNPKTSGGRR